MGPWRVLLASSSLFGLWHVFPSLSFASANQAISDFVPTTGVATTVLVVVGTVLFTGLGGVVAGELRRRSGASSPVPECTGPRTRWGSSSASGLASRRLTAMPYAAPSRAAEAPGSGSHRLSRALAR